MKKQSPDQLISLKEKLFNRYFDELDQMASDPSKAPRRVQADNYSLMFNFPDERQALETNAIIERVKQILRHEMKEERLAYEQARESAKQRGEWEAL